MNGQRKISNRLWPQPKSDLLYQRKYVDGTAFTDRFSEIDLRVDAKQFWIQYPRALESHFLSPQLCSLSQKIGGTLLRGSLIRNVA